MKKYGNKRNEIWKTRAKTIRILDQNFLRNIYVSRAKPIKMELTTMTIHTNSLTKGIVFVLIIKKTIIDKDRTFCTHLTNNDMKEKIKQIIMKWGENTSEGGIYWEKTIMEPIGDGSKHTYKDGDPLDACAEEILKLIKPMTEQERNIYKVKSINQDTGENMTTYVASFNMQRIEDEFADIISIEPLSPFEDLELLP
ncbi:MAG: hypothetical protein NUV58_01995 [Candidatus Roizmanbacteria bacterium]|nr:hypothetical protein [Candidatus Roizmanbacteria bacterium]